MQFISVWFAQYQTAFFISIFRNDKRCAAYRIRSGAYFLFPGVIK